MRELQERLKVLWTGKTYTRNFKGYSAQHKDFQHALMHIVKASGKLAALVEDQDHEGREEFPQAAAQKYLSDVIICALRMGNTTPGGAIDMQEAVIARINEKMGPVKPLRKITPDERERLKKTQERLGYQWDESAGWTELSEEQLGEVIRSYSGPFALHRDIWHRLECSSRESEGAVHKMRCGLEVRTRIELRLLTDDPEPAPRCVDCMKAFVGNPAKS